jgi:hypothetical protein
MRSMRLCSSSWGLVSTHVLLSDVVCCCIHVYVQVGMGIGGWSEDKVKTDYNLVNPPLRDTATGEKQLWTVLHQLVRRRFN